MAANGFKPRGAPVIWPTQIGHDHLHVGKEMDGGFRLTVNNQSIRLSPAQFQDFCIKGLRSLGMRIEEVPAMQGPRLLDLT